MDEIIIKLIASQYDWDEKRVTLSSNLAEDLSFDSLDKLDLTISLEKEFNIELPLECIDNFITVSDVIDTVHRTLDNKNNTLILNWN